MVILGLVISVLHTRCFASFRARRRHARRSGSFQLRARGRRRRGVPWCHEEEGEKDEREERRAAMKARLRAWAHGLRDGVRDRVNHWQQRRRRRRGGPLQDEEKETESCRPSMDIPPSVANRPVPPPPPPPPVNCRWDTVETTSPKPESEPEPKSRNHRQYPQHDRQQKPAPSSPPRSRRSSSGDESDALSTTMEQELAQFRAVAGVVGDLVAAEESRRRTAAMAAGTRPPEPLTVHPYHFGMYHPRARRYSRSSGHGHTAPPSPTTSSCPSYTSTDETLPPYDEVSRTTTVDTCPDGFRYAPAALERAPRYTSPAGVRRAG